MAFRIPQDKFCKKFIKRFGKPNVSTLANMIGEEMPKSFSEVSQPILNGEDYVVNFHFEKTTNKSSKILIVVDNNI